MIWLHEHNSDHPDTANSSWRRWGLLLRRPAVGRWNRWRPPLGSNRLVIDGAAVVKMDLMRTLKLFLLLPLWLSAILLTQCSRPTPNPGDAPGAGAAPPSGALPSGISPSGGPNNDPKRNPNNPQTNPATNLDGTQSPSPDKRNSQNKPQ